MKYLVTIHYTDTVEAENADEAVNAVFEDLDSQSNMSLTNTLCQYHTTVEPVADATPGPKTKESLDDGKEYIATMSVGVIGIENTEDALEQFIDVVERKAFTPEAFSVKPVLKQKKNAAGQVSPVELEKTGAKTKL